MGRLSFVFGFILGLIMFGCVGASFSYQYYGLEGVDYSKGRLLGPKESDDLPFGSCEPSDSLKHPCVIMKQSQFFQLKQDYEDIQNQLSECQKKIQ